MFKKTFVMFIAVVAIFVMPLAVQARINEIQEIMGTLITEREEKIVAIFQFIVGGFVARGRKTRSVLAKTSTTKSKIAILWSARINFWLARTLFVVICKIMLNSLVLYTNQ